MSKWERVAQPVRCKVELDKQLTVRRERGVLAQGDANANAIIAEVYLTDGLSYDLTGCTALLTFVRPDNLALPPITAEISGNTATATLTDACYEVTGTYAATMQLRKGGDERTILWIIGDVKGKDIDGIVDPEHEIISIEDLMATAAEAQKAANAANTAAARANAGAERAEQLQIDASGLAGDSNKLGGKPPEAYTAMNLLDNSDWRENHFIAQAGINGAHDAAVYLGDRWVNDRVTGAVLTSNGLQCTTSTQYAYVYQHLSNLDAGKAYTYAIKRSGAVASRIAVFDTALSESYATAAGLGELLICTFNAPSNEVLMLVYPAFAEGGGTATLWEPVLYEGTYTAETLPPFVPRPYAVELAECRRYYRQKVFEQVVASVNQYGQTWYISIPMDGEMRTAPSLEKFHIVFLGGQSGEVNGVNISNYTASYYRADKRCLSFIVTFADTYPKPFTNAIDVGYMAVEYALNADLR